jgi:hypothetical protein
MDRSSFITNPSFDMTIVETRKTRDRSSFLSNPSFDMTVEEEPSRRNHRHISPQQQQEFTIPPTLAPTLQSDASSSLHVEDKETHRTIEIYEESFVESLEVSSYFQLQQEQQNQQRPKCLNYINFLMCLANTTVAYLMGPAAADIYDQYPTLITPADFCFSFQGILYVSQFIWAMSQILGTAKHHPLVVHGVGWCYLPIASLQIAWYFLFCNKRFLYAMIVHGLLAITSLWMVLKRFHTNKTNNVPEYLTLQLPFDLQAAWVLGTSLVLVNITLVAFAFSTRVQILVASASLLAMAMVGVWCVVLVLQQRESSSRRVIPLLVVLGWICLGMASANTNRVILVEHFSSTTLSAISMGVAIVAAGLLISTILFVALMLRRHQDSNAADAAAAAAAKRRKNQKLPKTLGPPTSSMARPTTDPSSAFVKVGAAMIAAITLAVLLQPHEPNNVVHVAMIGNSMMYYNDLPRLLEAMSAQTLGDNTTQRIHQDSCLHGGADFGTHLQSGNGMYAKWKTGNARIWDHAKNYNLYDWGACTPEQLLLGYDDRLEAVMQENGIYNNDDTAADEDNGNNNNNRKLYNGDDDTWNYDDRITQEFSDVNPCHQNGNYYNYYQEKYETNGPPKWDYIVLNDDTRSPCCTAQRESSLELLKEVFIPLFLETGATPIFMMTYGYWTSARDMSGLDDIPTFTSYNYAGYRAYAELAAEYLPASQKPRIAPVGLAFLLIWEEKPTVGVVAICDTVLLSFSVILSFFF